MDPNTQQNNGAGQPQVTIDSSKKSFGPVIGIIIIIIILIVGALYFWKSSLNIQKATENTPEIPAVSSSDEVSAIENDLNVETLSDASLGLDELNSIETDLNSEINTVTP